MVQTTLEASVGAFAELSEPALPLSARGCQRHKDLIAAALRVLVRDGHHAVTLRTVSVEANASHGAINGSDRRRPLCDDLLHRRRRQT